MILPLYSVELYVSPPLKSGRGPATSVESPVASNCVVAGAVEAAWVTLLVSLGAETAGLPPGDSRADSGLLIAAVVLAGTA